VGYNGIPMLYQRSGVHSGVVNPMNPLVSIITPTYNHEKYIADCIHSSISQTYQNWEMIIIDDGSTDRTPDIIKSFSDNRIKYIRQKHLGADRLGITYNNALKEAKGNFIAVLEGDDFWPPNKLALQMPYFSDNKVVLTYGDCIVTDKNGRNLFYRKIINDKSIRDNKPVGSTLQYFLTAENFIYAQTVMFRKETLLKIGGFIQPDYLHLVDYPTYCRLALEGEFKGIPYPLGYWRRNINSLTFSNSHIISVGFIRYIKEFINQYGGHIQKLGIEINIEESLKKDTEKLNNSCRHQNYHNGLITLIYGYNKAAISYFHLYLKQRDKKLFYTLISLIGIILSHTHLLEIIFPTLGIYFSRVLATLKKWLLK
jgi:glycosyltransferase involved in cell wall biosynthesis